MKSEEKCKNPLVALLTAKMGAEGVSATALAMKFGISQGYMSQLLREEKDVAATSDDFLRQCAEFLGLPGVTCFLLAGRLVSADFYRQAMSFKQQLEIALQDVAKAVFALEVAVSYEQLICLPLEVQHLLVLLHEKAFSVELMRERVTMETLQAAMQPHVPFTVTKVKFF